MSIKGSIARGEKWYNLMRNADGDVVCTDANKLKDIENYTNSKVKVEPKVAKEKK